MALNLMELETEEAERLAYAEGFTMAAELFARIAELDIAELEAERDARIAELEAERDALAEELEDLKDKAAEDSLTQWENQNGNPDQYKEFFYDCFARLAGEYPAPSVSNDYDKSVIFEAIERGEELDANGGAA